MDDLENTPKALIGLLADDNFGKRMVRVAYGESLMKPRSSLIVIAAVALQACATEIPPPPDFALTWAKPGVSLDAFRADVDACNAAADTAAAAAPAAKRVRAQTKAYEKCFEKRDYTLIYIRAEDTNDLNTLAERDSKLRELHALSSRAEFQAADIDLGDQKLPLCADVPRPGH